MINFQVILAQSTCTYRFSIVFLARILKAKFVGALTYGLRCVRN